MRPPRRPGPSSPTGANSPVGAASAPISPANGSVPARPLSYLTTDRLHQLSLSLSPLDWQLLQFLHDSRFATGAQLTRAFWQTDDATTNAARRGRRALKRLSGWRAISTLPRSVSGMRGHAGLVYYTGHAGVRLLSARGITGPRVEVPGTLHLTHTLATTELALRLTEADRDGALELIAVQQEPVCWRTYSTLFGATSTLKPDLFIRIGAGEQHTQEDRWFAEIDLGTESARTIARKATAYAEHYRTGAEQHTHGVYPRVAWLVPDQQRAHQVQSVLERQDADTRRLFTIRCFDEAVAFLAAEARS